jgi:hypothetical protein
VPKGPEKMKISPGMVMEICNPSIWDAEGGDRGFEANLDYIARPCLKKLTKPTKQDVESLPPSGK